MKLGVLTNVVGNMSLEDALKYFKSMGIQMVEIGCGGYPGKDHCDPEGRYDRGYHRGRTFCACRNGGVERTAGQVGR